MTFCAEWDIKNLISLVAWIPLNIHSAVYQLTRKIPLISWQYGSQILLIELSDNFERWLYATTVRHLWLANDDVLIFISYSADKML